MNTLIPDNWLKDFLKTKAKAKQIADYLSLSGPSVESFQGSNDTAVYSIEVTTNRVDAVSVFGIARELAAILPRFGIKASLQPLKLQPLNLKPKVGYLRVKVDGILCPRFTAALIKNVSVGQSPSWMRERLTAVGVRPINNVVDISNYIMHELGQPVHTFDYDKIKKATMILKAAKPGESITTLDDKTHKLPGGDIIIEDGEGRLIDLAGIMGGLNSAVDTSTKNVLLFVQTYNPVNIRKTSMSLAHRTEAAVLFEKGLDPELVRLAMARGIELFEKLTGGKTAAEVLDIYPHPYKATHVTTSLDFINQRLGTVIDKKTISKILLSLGFEAAWKGKNLLVSVPSYRALDIAIAEDVVEEIARIYGYHQLPSQLMQGALPGTQTASSFDKEAEIKQILKSYGGVELYSQSLVPESFVGENALKLKNPLGAEGAYLRDSLLPSLVAAARENSREEGDFHLFEMANVYLPRRSHAKAGTFDLPEEKLTLAGILVNTPYRQAKGMVEGLLTQLNIDAVLSQTDEADFLPSHRLEISTGKKKIGQFGVLDEGFMYYEFSVEDLAQSAKATAGYKPVPKFPAQIEDLTFTFAYRTKVGEVLATISQAALVSGCTLTKIYGDAFTFRVRYQHPDKTLSDSEVAVARQGIISKVKRKFGGAVK